MVSLHYHHIHQGEGYPRSEGGYTSTYNYDERSPYPSKSPRPPRVTVGDGGDGESIKNQEHYFLSPPTSIECIEPQPQEELDHYTININMEMGVTFWLCYGNLWKGGVGLDKSE